MRIYPSPLTVTTGISFDLFKQLLRCVTSLFMFFKQEKAKINFNN